MATLVEGGPRHRRGGGHHHLQHSQQEEKAGTQIYFPCQKKIKKEEGRTVPFYYIISQSE